MDSGKDNDHVVEPDSVVTRAEALLELERVISDPDFHCTDRNKKFLSFVSDAFFQGRESAIKAYTIAVDVFGRPSSFDPATDPIVRIEATRLRASLAHYYETHAPDSGVRIDLPKGRYIPVFSRAATAGSAASGRFIDKALGTARALTMPAKAPFQLGRQSRLTFASLLVAAGVVALGTLTVFLFPGLIKKDIVSEKPLVSIKLKSAEGSDQAADIDMRDTLMVALSQFQTLRVASPEVEGNDDNFFPRTESTPAVANGFFHATRYVQSSYQVVLKMRSEPSERSVWWQIIDTSSGEALKTGVETVLANRYLPADLEGELVNRVAMQIAGANGAINGIETVRELTEPTLGTGCTLRAHMALATHDVDALHSVLICLDKTLALRPNDADAHAVRALVLLRLDPVEKPTELTREALQSAEKAVSLAPSSDRSAYAQMLALFRTGQIQPAIIAGRRARELNPNNIATTAKLSSLLFTVGDWEEGTNLALQAARFETLSYHDAEITLAMDAYRRGEFGEALLRIQQMGEFDCYYLRVLRVATLAQLGQSEEAASAAQQLLNYRPKIEASFQTDMEARHLAPTMIASVKTGLTKAGLRVR